MRRTPRLRSAAVLLSSGEGEPRGEGPARRRPGVPVHLVRQRLGLFTAEPGVPRAGVLPELERQRAQRGQRRDGLADRAAAGRRHAGTPEAQRERACAEHLTN